jgi:hypothetical protein
MAARTILPVATHMMIGARKYSAIVASGRIANQHSMVILSRRRCFLQMLLFAAIRNRIERPFICLHR